MKATKALIVTSNMGVIEVSIENLLTAAEVRGWKVIGTKTQRGAIALREEIEGQPMFDKLVGPFYGGPGVVRYEDSKTYDMLST